MSQAPRYQLEVVIDLARTGKVTLRRTAALRAQDLGYSTAEVIECLTQLKSSQFQKTIQYDDGLYDVYVVHVASPAGHCDEIYVKFKIPESATIRQVIVLSFHL